MIFLIFTQSLSNWIYFVGGENNGDNNGKANNKNIAEAAGPVEENKLIAIFVEQNIYKDIENNLQRYALQYIQGRFPRTKALIFPVDTTTIKPNDIQKILSNLYYGGEKDVPSTLIGTILIGNIPLPTIETNINGGTSTQKSILPYTDLEKPSYIFNTEKNIFAENSTQVDNQQELFHGLIIFNNIEKYNIYFEKIKKYINNPTDFSTKKIWYEDFIQLQKNYTDQNIPFYAKKQIFDEDLLYHRYTPSLFNILSEASTTDALKIFSEKAEKPVLTADNNSTPLFTEEEKAYNKSLEERQGNLADQANTSTQQLKNTVQGENIPTLIMGQSILQQLKNYADIYAPEYGDIIFNQLGKSGRWTGVDIGNSITKISAFDQMSSELLFSINTVFEKNLDTKISGDNLALKIPLPIGFTQFQSCVEGGKTPKNNEKPNIYEAHYFGKNAWSITGVDQTTWFRGSYENNTKTTDSIQKPYQESGSSIGATYNITNQQVIASRGYNVMKIAEDMNIIQNVSGYCKSIVQNKKNPAAGTQAYIQYYWGGNTAMNLTGDGPMNLVSNTPERGYNPSMATGEGGGPLFDIAGSTLTTGNNISGASAAAINTFGYYRFVSPNPLGIVLGMVSGIFGTTDVAPRCFPTPPIATNKYNFFSIANQTTQSKSNIGISIVTNETGYNTPRACITKYYYRPIPSTIKHTSPTPDEVKGMNITTPARGVDTKRYISFTSLAGNSIELSYPNLYDVPVYKKEGTIWKLQTTPEIKENIKVYLQNIVKEYNQKLLAENDKITKYYTDNSTGFNLLAQKDTAASPANRSYTALPEDFYTKLISDETLTQLADVLYIKNSPWQSKIAENTVGQMIDQATSTIHIENKIHTTLQRNLVEGEKGLGVNTNGYEVAYIRSNGADTISSSTSVPSFIQQAMQRIDAEKTQKNTTANNSRSDMQQQAIDTACSVGADGSVPILQWPKALKCWRTTLQKNVKDGKVVEISYKNALGPVYPLDQFGQKLKESYTNYIDYVNGVINPKVGSNPQDSYQDPSINAFTLGSIQLQIPAQTIIRGGQIPISITAKNKNNELITSLIDPIHISVSAGYFPDASYDNDLVQQIDITDPTQPVILDTTNIPSLTTIHITASGDGMLATGELLVVDGTLRTQVNNNTTTSATIQLPNTSYTNTTIGLPIVYEEKLPTLSLSLNDPNGKPIYTVAQITSENGLIQPCKLTSNEAGKQCMQESLWDINGTLNVKLLPSMKAGTDSIHINISGLPERTIQFTILPANPYKVEIQANTGTTPTTTFSVFDTRGNLVQQPATIQYTLIGDITNSSGTKENTLSTTSGKVVIPIQFGSQGGANYIYATINGQANSLPGYLRWDTPMTLWPQEKLNVVYLTLLGKDWGNTDATPIPDMITSSSKLLTVTTSLTNSTNDDTVNLEPLRSYGGGKTVGEARKMTFDPSIITYGDPMLQHADALKPTTNDTTEVKIAGDSNKTIKKVVEFDIDNDGRKDLLILYDDDTIELQKQYGGMPSYRKLGNLMSIVDGVDQIWVGDVNNDKLPDIFVKTKRNTLRVYTNQLGSFATEGKPVCLDIPDGPTSIKGIWDLDIADMNKDGNIDIVTNDTRGQIRIFYGGDTGKGGYYLSTTGTGCDTERYQRQKDNNLTVATFGFSLNEGAKIYDDSLVHWQGLTLPSDDASTNIPDGIKNSLPNTDNMTLLGRSKNVNLKNFGRAGSVNVEGLIKNGLSEIIRYSGTPYDALPIYEKDVSLNKIAYIPSRYLTGNDAISTYKVYTKGINNTIRVTVYIQAKKATKATYFEDLRGPWKVARNEDKSISGFAQGGVIGGSIINREPGNNYQFMVDNISLQAGETITFSYPIVYTPTQVAHISVEDTNKDGWLDIKTKSVDDCSKTNITYQSQAGKSYQTIKEEIKDTKNVGETTQKKADDILDQAANGNLTKIDGLSDMIENWDSSKTILANILDNGFTLNGSFSLDDSILGKQINEGLDNTEKTISTLLQGACKGFVSGGGSSKGLPVPFNVAFLAPGDINVFGCKVFHDKGLPIFAFPTAGIVPVWPPTPTNAGGRLGGDSSISQIRIYVAPTLTQSVGVAVCLGPYGVGAHLPSPFNSIAGNCIVFAKKAGSSSTTNTAGDHTEDIINEDTSSVGNTCRNPFPDSTRPISPITYGVTDGGTNNSIELFGSTWKPASAQDSSIGPSITRGTYLGVLDVDVLPEVENNLYKQQTDNLQGGKPIQLKIQGGNVKGLIKCVVQKRLDNQIRYIANNLTNMSINIILPDIGNIGEGFANLDFKGLDSIIQPFTKNSTGKSPVGEALTDVIKKTKGETSARVEQDDVTSLNSMTANPFNALSARFDQVPMIRVNTRNVNVQIPFIYSEELTKYEAQAKGYQKKLEENFQTRARMIQDMAGICPKIENELQRKACNTQLENYIQIKDKIGQLQTSIKSNLATLQAYKRFPASLKERVTVNERYMTELSSTMQGISTDMTSWLNTNATRFSSYVDSIILMVGAVKSRQTIIDFSTNWKSKCGKCTVDTYDYYSCALGLLCPSLPILAIPPFKIPNIYVDLSNINIGLDLLLPNIRFVPRRIALPDLPDIPMLPAPPTITTDFTIGRTTKVPSIPTLPAPPILPELPSFIPSIDLNLPTLPPAPKIPQIAPAINTTLKVMTKIGKILCIIKNGISLVGENSVKSRIEQLTQRTRSVEPFDSLTTTRVTPPLRGFDIKISTYLNFELNFEGLYDVLNTLVQKVNDKSKQFTDRATQQTTFVETGLNSVIDYTQKINTDGTINIKGDIGTDGITVGSVHTNSFFANANVYTSNTEPELVDTNTFRTRLQSEITAFKQSDFANEYKNDIQNLQTILDTNTQVKPNYDSLQKATNTLQALIAEKKNSMSTIKQQLDDYDRFLDKANTAALISDNTVEGTISVNFFNVDEKTKYIMDTAEHPLTTYLHLENNLASGFLNALNNHSADELNMSIFTHDKLLQFFKNTVSDIEKVKGVIQPITQQNKNTSFVNTTIENTVKHIQTTLAPTALAAPISTTTDNTSMTPLDSTSISTYNTPSTRITPTSEIPNDITTRNTTTFSRSTRTTESLLGKIWWDDHYVYTNQTTLVSQKNDGTRYSRYYLFKPIQYYRNLLEQADENGFVSVYNSSFDVGNIAPVITSFQIAGQSNNTVSMQRNNTNQQVYILSLENRIINHHELTTTNKYVLAYAEGIDLTKTYIDIAGLPNKTLANLTPQDNIIVVPINTDNDIISLTLDLPEKKRSYIQIAQCSVTPRSTLEGTVVHRTSAWSAQETLGAQQQGDTVGPTANVQVTQRDTKEIIASGTNIVLPRKGAYDIQITWSDDETVVQNTRNKKSDTNIVSNNGPVGIIQNIPIQNDNTPLIYNITATDQAENTSINTITLTFTDPIIRIQSAPKTNEGFTIDSNLSTLYPNGYVRFFATRDGISSLLTGINNQQTKTDFATRSMETTVTGGVFVDADTISLFTANKDLIAKIDKKTAKITPSSAWQSRLDLRIDTSNNIPIVLFIDKETGISLFSLYLKVNKTIQSQSLDITYPLVQIPSNFPGTFGGGQCLQDTINHSFDKCLLYISADGNIFIPDANKIRFGGRYEYDGGVRYTLTLDGKDILRTLFIPNSLQ